MDRRPPAAAAQPSWMFQKLGPTGSLKSPSAANVPSACSWIGSWGSGRAAGPKTGTAPRRTSNVDWWQGQRSRCSAVRYNPTGQPAWVQTFEYATKPFGAQAARSAGRVSRFGSTWIRTTWPFAEPGSPSGKTVANDPIGGPSAVIGSPSTPTSRRPWRHELNERGDSGPGPRAKIGTASAAPTP